MTQEAFAFAQPERRPRAARPPNGARVKGKGSAFERYVASLLAPIFGEARRGNQRSPFFRESDVVAGPIWWECKHSKQVNLRSSWTQAASDWRKRGQAFAFPVVVGRDNGQAPFVILRLSDFLPMLAAWWAQETRRRSDTQDTPAGRGRRLLGSPRRRSEAMTTWALVRKYACFGLGLPEGASPAAVNRALVRVEAAEDAGRIPYALACLAKEAHLILTDPKAGAAATNRYDALPNPEGSLRRWIARAHALAGRTPPAGFPGHAPMAAGKSSKKRLPGAADTGIRRAK